ncbi:Protein LDB17 [Meyerozyma sp. JA9]|nr:Protein LDB17 [Meyerozyma sp. JA9]
MHSPGGTQHGSPPVTSFPNCQFVHSPAPEEPDTKESDIRTILINSDPDECNNNISLYFKHVVDASVNSDGPCDKRNYHKLSVFALRLLNSNLFAKNYSLCLGKILSLLTVFTEMEDTSHGGEVNCIKEFACVCLLLLLKMKNESHESSSKNDSLSLIDIDVLFTVLRKLDLVTILARFIACHIQSLDEVVTSSSYILLKFACDIIFEYLYYWELLSDDEFFSLTVETAMVPVLITHLLSHNKFSDYSNDREDEWEDEANLMAYEELKLLLIVNEQYLMKSYYTDAIKNQVFNGLLIHGDSQLDTQVRIANFINLLVYHINREESSIVKILILKFLYLVFTTSYTTKLVYLNDLKILVDIFIRELNNLDYSDDIGQENRVLIITYLKVLCPLLTFSQISESGYKNEEIIELMRNLISNSTAGSVEPDTPRNHQVQTIAKLAMKCLDVPWLKPKRTAADVTPIKRSTSASSLSSLAENLSIDTEDDPFARVASVRTSTHADYHKHTTSHNNEDVQKSQIVENNGNVFLSAADKTLTSGQTVGTHYSDTSKLLALPKEFLQKHGERPMSPFTSDLRFVESRNSSSSSVASASSVTLKGRKKKAPPPPNLKMSSMSPPPPPPPRRRR